MGLDVHHSCPARQGLGGLDNDCHMGVVQQLQDRSGSFTDFDWRTRISDYSKEGS